MKMKLEQIEIKSFVTATGDVRKVTAEIKGGSPITGQICFTIDCPTVRCVWSRDIC